MKVIGYIRISTQEQANGFGLEMQEEAIRACCEKNGWMLAEVYLDIASGTIKNRPGFTDAMEALKICDGIVVYHTDRLSRKLKHLLQIIDDIHHIDKRLISTTQPEFDNSPMSRLLLGILGSVAEWELSRITERMTAGRETARKRAEGTNGKRPRYDEVSKWEIKPDGSVVKLLEKDEAALETIALIKRHRRSGKSYYKIAKWLDEKGIPNKYGSYWNPGIVSHLCRIEL
jgi:site-specific DNA recombinase